MILIEPDVRVPRAALPKRELTRFLRDACERIGLEGEVTVLLVNDQRIRELNRMYRRKNKVTDVLSFPSAPAGFAGQEATGGDLAISVDTARQQAEGLGHALLAEVRILILHGLLHLAGQDHEKDSGQMARLERKFRLHYQLPQGLIQRSASHLPPSKVSASKVPAGKVIAGKVVAGKVSPIQRSTKKTAASSTLPSLASPRRTVPRPPASAGRASGRPESTR